MSREDDIVARLRKQYVGNYNALLWDEAADEIERLRSVVARVTEEAREIKRLCCELQAEADALGKIASSPQSIAEEYGFDCYGNEGGVE
jgi:hypothetical protein